eukprot:TCONS_00022795-protein
MAQLSKNQRVWICLEYARTNNNSEVIRRWRRHWPNILPPTIRTIMKAYNKLLTEGTCLNLNKGRSSPRHTVTTPANIQLGRNSLIANGRRSLRRNGLRLTRSTFLRIAKTIATDLSTPLLQILASLTMSFFQTKPSIFSLNSQVDTKNVIKYSQHGNGHPEDHFVEFKSSDGFVGFDL